MEEKYARSEKVRSRVYGDKYDEDSESSDDEEEDDTGFLVTEALDAEISATLQAIRSKNPIVYDENYSFYKPVKEDEVTQDNDGLKLNKPMYLRDYHRENILKGNFDEDALGDVPQSFTQKQKDLQSSVITEMHAAVECEPDIDDIDNFLTPKNKSDLIINTKPSSESKAIQIIDISTADKDPDTFLTNFNSSHAWIPKEGTRFQPLESDDDSEEERAEKFETAYNLRFEEPADSNEILKSYSRDAIAAKSVRRNEVSSRKKQRDAHREKKLAEKKKVEEEKARLVRLKVDEMEERIKMIRKAAGIRGEVLNRENIVKFLNEVWDNDKWTEKMDKYFGKEYYDGQEIESEDESNSTTKSRSKKKIKKPKWDNDIHINDILPEFCDEEMNKTGLGQSESERETKITRKKSRHDKISKKKADQLDRKQIQELVKSRMEPDVAGNSKHQSRFRYRETSPVSFGLTVKDILMAPDESLNQFAGLKKFATFRNPEKKRKDKKNLGKKARLRQWRRETFGNENEPEISIEPDTIVKIDSN